MGKIEKMKEQDIGEKMVVCNNRGMINSDGNSGKGKKNEEPLKSRVWFQSGFFLTMLFNNSGG